MQYDIWFGAWSIWIFDHAGEKFVSIELIFAVLPGSTLTVRWRRFIILKNEGITNVRANQRLDFTIATDLHIDVEQSV